MDRMIALNRRFVVVIVVLASILILVGCPAALIDDIEGGGGDEGIPLLEKNYTSTASFKVGSGYNDSINSGAGESITLAKAYIPTFFSVYVHASEYFKLVTVAGSQEGVSVDLRLDIWDQVSETLLAFSSAHINARTIDGEEEVIFTINGAPVINANRSVLYLVYLPDSTTLDHRGELLYYASTDPAIFSKGVFWRSTGANDTTIQSIDGWMESSTNTYDLKFKLVGVEQ